MAYVPGFQHDVFVSYANADDRTWVNDFVGRLRPALKRKLGIEAEVWIDDESLRKSGDYKKEIPESVRSSAVFLLLTSPLYIGSPYCVDEECPEFEKAVARRRSRFQAKEFDNELFALRCPILADDLDEQRKLFHGVSDIPFCDDQDTFPIGSPEFETSFRKLIGALVVLLKRMRNHCTPVFLYPRSPGPDIQAAYRLLAAELSAQSYRVLPEKATSLDDQLRKASLSVFLLGKEYDERAKELAEIAATEPKPWVVWSSPAAEQLGVPEQVGLCRYLEQIESPKKIYLNARIEVAGLKETVLQILRPDSPTLPTTDGKPRVYLIYNSHDRAETGNAGQIALHYRRDFHFDLSDDFAQHTLRLSKSDGILLVWGSAAEDWCSHEFEQMIMAGRHAGIKGLCLFDPEAEKTAAVGKIRESFKEICVTEQFGPRFDPARMEAFFSPIRRRAQAGPR